MKLLWFPDLKGLGIPFSKPTILKKEKEGTFPMRMWLSERKRPWTQEIIEDYLRGLAAESATATKKARQAAASPSQAAPPARRRKSARAG